MCIFIKINSSLFPSHYFVTFKSITNKSCKFRGVAEENPPQLLVSVMYIKGCKGRKCDAGLTLLLLYQHDECSSVSAQHTK